MQKEAIFALFGRAKDVSRKPGHHARRTSWRLWEGGGERGEEGIVDKGPRERDRAAPARIEA